MVEIAHGAILLLIAVIGYFAKRKQDKIEILLNGRLDKVLAYIEAQDAPKL